MSKSVKIYRLRQALKALRAEFHSFKRKVNHEMSRLDTSVDAVVAAEKEAEARVAAAEQKAADAQTAAETAQATAEANAKIAQDAAAELQTQIDAINAGEAVDADKLDAVKASLDAINADPPAP